MKILFAVLACMCAAATVSAQETGGKETIVMLHFPPLFADGFSTGFTDILEQYRVSRVIYGHLHGAGIKIGFEGIREGIDYLVRREDYSPIICLNRSM